MNPTNVSLCLRKRSMQQNTHPICPTITFFTYISPLIPDTQFKALSTEGIDSSTSRQPQDTDAFHMEKFLVKHILKINQGAMSAVERQTSEG